MAGNPVVLGLMDQLIREVRHALGILYAGLHDVTDLPGPMVSRATDVVVFGATSPEHHSKLRGLRREFHPIVYDMLKDLPRGTCAWGTNESSDPKCAERAQIITLRPSCVHAGGETLTVQQAGPDLLRPM